MDARELADKLGEYPTLKHRFSELVNIIENPDGKTTLGDNAEMCVVEELRDLGNDTLTEWASKQSDKSSCQVEKEMAGQVRKRGKKKFNGTQLTDK